MSTAKRRTGERQDELHARVVTLYGEGLTGLQIAKRLHLTFGRVYQILREEGIQRQPRPKTPKVRIKIRRDRVVDRIIRFLAEHPMSTVEEIAKGISHENTTTVRTILSRLKSQGEAVSDNRNHASEPFLWSLPQASADENETPS